MKKSRILLAALLTLAVVSILYFSSSALMPFIIGYILAYLFRPTYTLFKRFKFSNTLAAFSVIALAGFLLFIFFATLLPILTTQISALISIVIDHKNTIEHLSIPINSFLSEYFPNSSTMIEQFIENFSSNFLETVGNSLQNILGSGLAAAHYLSLIIITPFAFYYFSKDWDSLTRGIYLIIPKKLHKKTKELLTLLDNNLSGYIRGQVIVCCLLASYYSIALLAIGLTNAIVIGIISGILTFIPFVGVFISFTLAFLVASLQFTNWHMLAGLATIYAIGQFFENNVIVPKIIGNSINIHPLWIIFGLLAGGSILGFTGILIALPLTAATQVIIKFTFKEIKS